MAYESNSKQKTNSPEKEINAGIEPNNLAVVNHFGVQKLYGSYSAEIIQTLSELYTEQVISIGGVGTTIESKSDHVLNALGFSVVETDELSPGLSSFKQFSLIGSTNIDETIENSKIVDPNLNKLTPNNGSIKCQTTLHPHR